ncbi:MAC/perforin domain-containing protein [Sphingobacterium sp. Lzh-3]|uniref:MAC/perforin domain-containing protein n=1 Tax=Sphingobacterium sp. Lzh-3 TaxID=3382150 RepID=UPI00398CD873
MKGKFLVSLLGSAIVFFSCSKDRLIESQSTGSLEKKAIANLQAGKFGNGIFNDLGRGYDMTGQFANAEAVANRVLNIDALNASQAGRVIADSIYSQEYEENYGENAESYSQSLTSKLNAGFSLPLFGKTLTNSFNSSDSSQHAFNSKYIYGSCNVVVKQLRHRINAPINILLTSLDANFLQDIKTLSAESIVKSYGTHVLVDIYAGAAMDVLFQSETKHENRFNAAKSGASSAMKDVFNISIANGSETSSSNDNYNRTLKYKTRGGDPSKALVNTINLDISKPQVSFASWQASSTISNSVLVDIAPNGLISLDEFIADPTKKSEVKAYISKYLLDRKTKLYHERVPIYSYVKNGGGIHLLSQSAYEGSYWKNETIGFYAYANPVNNSIPVRWYTTSPTMRDNLYTLNFGDGYWNDFKGVVFYAYRNQEPGTVPIYEYTNKDGKDHYYSPNIEGDPYWRRRGVAFYAYPKK